MFQCIRRTSWALYVRDNSAMKWRDCFCFPDIYIFPFKLFQLIFSFFQKMVSRKIKTWRYICHTQHQASILFLPFYLLSFHPFPSLSIPFYPIFFIPFLSSHHISFYSFPFHLFHPIPSLSISILYFYFPIPLVSLHWSIFSFYPYEARSSSDAEWLGGQISICFVYFCVFLWRYRETCEVIPWQNHRT